MVIQSGTEVINPFKVLELAGVRPGMHVADLGCGTLGHFILPAAQLVGPSGCVYAVDIQKAALQSVERQARQYQHWNVYPVWSDIDVLGATRIPEASLDVTLIINNFFLSTNRPSLVKEAFRLTRPGGRIAVVEWKKEQTTVGPEVSRRMDADEVRSFFTDIDLREIGTFPAGSEHYGLIFERLKADPMAEILSVSHPLDMTPVKPLYS